MNQQKALQKFNYNDFNFIKKLPYENDQYAIATNKRDNKKYRIKFILLYDSNVKKESEIEKKIFAKLNHPNLVRIIGSFYHEDEFLKSKPKFHCLVMEYFEHQSLEYIRKQPDYIDESQILDGLVQVLLALKYLNTKKIIHQNITSKNIFVNSKNDIKIGDFGSYRNIQNRYTDLGYNMRVNVFSLGQILYKITNKKYPFKDFIYYNRLSSHQDRLTPIKPVNSKYSQELQDLIVFMLSFDMYSNSELTFCPEPTIDDILEKAFIKEHCLKFLLKKLPSLNNDSVFFDQYYKLKGLDSLIERKKACVCYCMLLLILIYTILLILISYIYFYFFIKY